MSERETVSAEHLVLVGLMGAGKTTVGAACAPSPRAPVRRHRRPRRVDHRRHVAEIFATEGEPAFRDPERAAVADACASPAPPVIACGGGAVLDPENRRRLRDARRRGLAAGRARRARRPCRAPTASTARCSARPAPPTTLERLAVAAPTPTRRPRTPWSTPTAGRRRGRRRRARRCTPRRVTREARPGRGPAAAYDVVVGAGIARRGRCAARRPAPGRRRQPARGRRALRGRGRSTLDAGRRARSCMGDGEEAKTLDDRRAPLPAVRRVGAAARRRGRRARRRRRRRHRRLRRRRRTTAASRSCRCRRRCSPWSTRRSAARPAVNLPEGKNLVGAFHQPVGVLADTDTLATLPEREYRSGLGEVAKYALIGDVVLGPTDVVDLLRLRHADGARPRPGGARPTRRRAARAIKADVVAADPEERTGLRAVLNYGHTLAHALETARRLRAAARRGGRDRARVRRRSSRAACERVGAATSVDRYQARARDARAADRGRRAGDDVDPASCSTSCARQEGERAGSRSCCPGRDGHRAGRRPARARGAVRVRVRRHRAPSGRRRTRWRRSCCSRGRT